MDEPKKPIFRHKESALFAAWICPKCGWIVGEQFVPAKHNQNKSDYCKNCGQAIDWSDFK